MPRFYRALLLNRVLMLYRVLFWVTFSVTLLCLAAIGWQIFQSVQRSTADKTWQQAMDDRLRAVQADVAKNAIGVQGGSQTPAGLPAIPGTPVSADQATELRKSIVDARSLLLAEIHAADADERAVLDRLITLVGGFSAILGLCALATVKFARDEAVTQQSNIKSLMESFTKTAEAGITAAMAATQGRLKAIEDTSQTNLASLEKSARTRMEEFRQEIWRELPEMRNLKDSLRKLMLELDRTISFESDWNEAQTYKRLSLAQRESILIAEATVNALQVFMAHDPAADVAAPAKLYRALARFYFGRFRVQDDQTAGERAEIYARKSKEMDPQNPAADALQGAICLARYRLLRQALTATSPRSETDIMDAHLRDAVGFLKIATSATVLAPGAALNLALASSYQKDLDTAISVSTDTIQNRDKMSGEHARKYLPSLYLNLGCYLTRKADKQLDVDVQRKFRQQAIDTLSEGIAYLESRQDAEQAASSLREKIQREINDKDAFRNLTQDDLAALAELIKPKPNATGTSVPSATAGIPVAPPPTSGNNPAGASGSGPVACTI